MKTNRISFFIIMLVFIFWNKGFGQWYYHQLTPLVDLNSLAFTDENTGYICGNFQTLKKTTDGGVTWNPLNINAKGNLVSIKFPSVSIGYVASDSGQIFKTTDAGQNWTLIKSFHVPLWAVYKYRLYFFTNDIGLLAFDSSSLQGRIYRTTDGGGTWTNSILPDSMDRHFYHPGEYYFLNNSIGYIASNQGILKTVDGGISWTVVESLMGGESLCYLDTVHGFFISDRTLYESHDGGLNWIMINDNGFPTYVYFSSKDTGYVCVDTTVLQTINAGTSWNPMKIYGLPVPGVTVVKTEMSFPVKNIGYALGPGGSFLNCNLNANGIEDKTNLQSDVQLMQNPVSGSFIRFQIIGPNKSGSIHIFDCLGKEVKKVDNLKTGIVEIDRFDISPGMYLYNYIDNKKINSCGKIIIN